MEDCLIYLYQVNEKGETLRELVGTGLPYKFGEPETKKALTIWKDAEKRKKEAQIRQRIREGTIVRTPNNC